MKKRKLNLVVLIAILVCLTSGCGTNSSFGFVGEDKATEIEEKINDYKFGITREQFNDNFDVPKNEDLISIADGLLKDKLTVMYTIDSMEYSLDTLDWNVLYTDSPNTFQLYLQCLNPVMYLTKAYEITGTVEYLDFAEKFINSWFAYASDNEKVKGNNFVWYDHGTALRAENLIYFALVADRDGYLKDDTRGLIVNLLNIHGKFLSSEDAYTKNHNHGIFQDRALIYIAYFLDNDNKDEWLNIAKDRLSEQKEYAFSSEMVHVENSPGYQIGVMDLFRTIAEFLEQFDDEFGNELYKDVQKSAEFMAYIIKPNGYAAEIGDTNGSLNTSPVTKSALDVYNNPHLTYSAMLGQSGEEPENKVKFYPKSGYYISHNDWSSENYTNSTWAMFKSGYSSKTHKHADDNSFMLYSKGYDIFSDQGWYNYVEGNRYRDYFVSSLAHNTVVVDEKTYSRSAENSYKTGIFDYGETKNYSYAAGFNDMYSGVMFDRYFYNLGDAFIIYDNIVSDEEHTYSQLFHIPEFNKVIEHNDEYALISIGNSKYRARIRQYNSTKLEVIHGDFDKEKFGYISHVMNNIKSTSTLKFDSVGKNIDFITVITIEDENGNVMDINSIDFDKDKKEFAIIKSDGTNFNLTLTERKRIYAKDVSVNKIGKNEFEFINNNIGDDLSYAWYVIDKDASNVIYKTDYTEENKFIYEFDDGKEYIIKSYVKNKSGQRKQAIIADIAYNSENKEWTDDTKKYPYLNLEYNGQSYKKISDNSYEFTVDYNYSLNSSISWYVYYNGSYLSSSSTYNEKTIQFDFNQPGKYTVIYYLRTSNGDNEFWNFEEIEV